MQNIIQKIFPPRKIPEKTVENLTQEISAFSELQKLCKSLDEPTIFDVGAHIGQTANEFRRRFPKARIFSFEPFPNSFQTLSANFELDTKTKVFNYGFAEKLGKFPFHDNSSSVTNSLLSTEAMGSVTWGEGLLETRKNYYR